MGNKNQLTGPPPEGGLEMLRQARILGAFLFLAPIAVGMDERPDSSMTTFRVAGGIGSYAVITRDCSGNAISIDQEQFKDIGAELNHQFRPGASTGASFHVGVRGGYLEDHREFRENYVDEPTSGQYYVNPYAAIEGGVVGFGAGMLFSNKQLYNPEKDRFPTGHLRIGRLSKIYFSTEVLENLPLYSGGGFVNVGLGSQALPKFGWWFGLSAGGPYDSGGFLAKLNIRPTSNWQIDANLRFGFAEGASEAGIGMGIRYNWIHP